MKFFILIVLSSLLFIQVVVSNDYKKEDNTKGMMYSNDAVSKLKKSMQDSMLQGRLFAALDASNSNTNEELLRIKKTYIKVPQESIKDDQTYRKPSKMEKTSEQSNEMNDYWNYVI